MWTYTNFDNFPFSETKNFVFRWKTFFSIYNHKPRVEKLSFPLTLTGKATLLLFAQNIFIASLFNVFYFCFSFDR